jgi:type III secretion protein W
MTDPRISGSTPISVAALQVLQKAVLEENIQQIESEQDLLQWCNLDAFNPIAMMRRFRPLDEFKDIHLEEQLEEQERVEHEEKIVETEKVEDAAARFQRDNFELQSKTLLILRSRLSAKDTPDDVLKKVLNFYPDPALADEAMQFLVETADPTMGAILQLAREKLNLRFEAEIRAGRNMGAQAREFSKQGLGSPHSLRDLYRDITQNPREPIILFNELSEKLPYSKLKTVIRFLLHSLGADLKSKGPSISRAELGRLIDETRSLQGILGIYRFFQQKMPALKKQFTSYDMAFPAHLQFEQLSKQMVKFIADRFFSSDKIQHTAKEFGISEETIAQIIVFSLMRDSLRQIAPRYFRNFRQRDEMFQIFLKAIDDLEDLLEREEEERSKKEKKK